MHTVAEWLSAVSVSLCANVHLLLMTLPHTHTPPWPSPPPPQQHLHTLTHSVWQYQHHQVVATYLPPFLFWNYRIMANFCLFRQMHQTIKTPANTNVFSESVYSVNCLEHNVNNSNYFCIGRHCYRKLKLVSPMLGSLYIVNISITIMQCC